MFAADDIIRSYHPYQWYIHIVQLWQPPPRCQVHMSLISGKHARVNMSLTSYHLHRIRQVCPWNLVPGLGRHLAYHEFYRRERKLIHFEMPGPPKWPHAQGRRRVSVLPFVDRIIKRSNCEAYCQWQALCECQRQVVANERQLSPAHLWGCLSYLYSTFQLTFVVVNLV